MSDGRRREVYGGGCGEAHVRGRRGGGCIEEEDGVGSKEFTSGDWLWFPAMEGA